MRFGKCFSTKRFNISFFGIKEVVTVWKWFRDMQRKRGLLSIGRIILIELLMIIECSRMRVPTGHDSGLILYKQEDSIGGKEQPMVEFLLSFI
jgi:hypothetical protein